MMEHILDDNNINYNEKVLVELIMKYYPDFRRTLNELQRYSAIGGIDSGILGQLGDSTKTSIGRRKPWIILGVPLMMLAIYKLFIPGTEVSIAYFVVWMMLMYLGSTIINIPSISIWALGGSIIRHYLSNKTLKKIIEWLLALMLILTSVSVFMY